MERHVFPDGGRATVENVITISFLRITRALHFFFKFYEFDKRIPVTPFERFKSAASARFKVGRLKFSEAGPTLMLFIYRDDKFKRNAISKSITIYVLLVSDF